MNPFTAAIHAVTSTIVILSSALAPLGGAALAVIVLTLLVRLALHPLTRRAVRGERDRARLAPQVAALRQKHTGNVTKFAEESAALHKAEGVSQFAGIGPMLIQAPVFLVLYRVFAHATGPLAGAHILGVPLSSRFLATTGGTVAHLIVFGAMFAALTLVAIWNSRRAAMLAKINSGTGTRGLAPATRRPAPGVQPSRSATSAKTPEPSETTARIMASVGRIAPYFVLLSAAFLPLAAGLYLVATTTWSAAENTLLRRGLPA